MLRFPGWTSRSLRIPVHDGRVAVRRAKVFTVPRIRPALFLVPPLLIAAGIQLSELLVPTEVRNHLDALERDWEDLKKKRGQVDQDGGKDSHVHDLPDSSRIQRGRFLDFSPFWVTIPIWTQTKKAAEYKATDPEWKEFVKLEQDYARVEKLKSTTARTVALAILDGLPPTMEKAWGFDRQVTYNSSHLDFVFPFAPPVVYERPGLLVTPAGIQWKSETLEDERGRKYHRIFHPTVFALAFWAGGKAFCEHHYSAVQKKAHELFGTQSKDPTPRQRPRGFRGYSASEQALLKKALTISSPTVSMDSEDSAELLRLLIPAPTSKSAMEAAVKAYKQKHTSLQISAWKECPRGGCYLVGFVDVVGTKATVRVNVKAVYLPSEDVFLGSPISGEALVMPKVSLMTADKLKVEKIKAEQLEAATRGRERKVDMEKLKALQEKMAKAKQDKMKMDPTKKDTEKEPSEKESN